MSNPYRLSRPAVVSFSGGRTSAFMLYNILEVWGGKLPEDVVPIFCNTGLEHHETYEFIHEIERRWCPIIWLEYCLGPDDEPTYQVVTYETAARNGEPFTALIRKKQFLPNPVTRMCTVNLKIRTAQRWCKDHGWEAWDNAIGLRADEPHRVHRLKADIKADSPVCPLYHAKHTIDDVLAFWKRQPFDLELPLKDVGIGNAYGNCVGCFLKGRDKLMGIMRREPAYFDWWVTAEEMDLGKAEASTRTFRKDRPPYAIMLEQSQRQGVLFEVNPEPSMPCMCTD